MLTFTASSSNFRITARRLLCGLALLLGAQLARGQEIQISFAMDADPLLQPPAPRWKLDEGLLPLWREALARPEAEYQLRVSGSIVLAHSEGFAGLEELQPDLLRVLTAESTHPAARFQAARALIVMDVQDAAESLFHLAREGNDDFRMLIEPALAAWGYEPARDLWRERIRDPETGRRALILAARCAAEVRDAEVVPGLLEIVHSNRPSDLRLEAARAAGAIADSGLVEDAERLVHGERGSILDRLCAVALLRRHASAEAQQILMSLGRESEPAVAVGALEALLSIDPELVITLAPESFRSPDAFVRLRAAQSYVALPTPERVFDLAELLNDPHPEVRVSIRESLLALAEQSELDTAVRDSAMHVLDGDDWRGQEQAAMLLAALDHEPAAPRMIELLDSPRGEVMLATAWGLRRLAIPETAVALLDAADRKTTGRLNGTAPGPIDEQVAHLFEALGVLKYRPAEPLMRRYIPKNLAYGELSRAAAIWALGHIFAAEANEDLASLFMERALDIASMPPEFTVVRLTSIVSIGRMQAESQLEPLHELLGPVVDHTAADHACHWAIQQMRDDDIPFAPEEVKVRNGWFLEPIAD